jgi:hypothetical protein
VNPSVYSPRVALKVNVFFDTLPSVIVVGSPFRVSVPVNAVSLAVRSSTIWDPFFVSPATCP